MLIYPAIDLLDGRCVRLRQGCYGDATTYSDDPVATAERFAKAGATHLHVVDLSGARDPSARQTATLARLLESTSLKIQVGGGLRSIADATSLLDLGADRVVLGSAAVTAPELVRHLLEQYGPARITVALDVRDDERGATRIALHAWQRTTELSVAEVLAPFRDSGLQRVLCTDIRGDGMMSGPNLALYRRLLDEAPWIELQASGGVRSLGDLRALALAGLRSAIVGRALYEGAVDLRDAVRQC